LECIVHVFWHLGTQVDIWSTHDCGQAVSELYLFNLDLKILVESVLVPYIGIVKHFELLVVWPLPLIS